MSKGKNLDCIVLQQISCVILLIFFTSCASKSLDKRDSYLYGQVGYDQGSRPDKDIIVVPPNVEITPDYYYHAPQPKRYTRPAAPNFHTPQGQYIPASRFYTNPYSFNPPASFPYYDSDRYYTPPIGQDNSQ